MLQAKNKMLKIQCFQKTVCKILKKKAGHHCTAVKNCVESGFAHVYSERVFRILYFLIFLFKVDLLIPRASANSFPPL